MRFDHQKAFPYPVLRPDVDDYLDGEFQVTVDMSGTASGAEIEFDVDFALSVPEIETYITDGAAAYAIVIACRDTYFRKTFYSQAPRIQQSLGSGLLHGEVIFYPFVVAMRTIEGYKCPDINPEFMASEFVFEQSEILAADEPKVLYVGRDLFKPVSSVFELVKVDNLSGWEWRLSFDQNKVRIQLSAEAKESIDVARNSLPNRAILINAIYFAAVMEAIQKVKENESAFEDYRWASVIKQQCHNAAIDYMAHDANYVAQRLLKYPLSLLHQYTFRGDD